MKRVRTRWLMAALLLLLPDLPACAQPSTAEFLPEIDAYVRLNSNVRFAFQAKETLKEGDLTRIEQMLENMFIGRGVGFSETKVHESPELETLSLACSHQCWRNTRSRFH